MATLSRMIASLRSKYSKLKVQLKDHQLKSADQISKLQTEVSKEKQKRVQAEEQKMEKRSELMSELEQRDRKILKLKKDMLKNFASNDFEAASSASTPQHQPQSKGTEKSLFDFGKAAHSERNFTQLARQRGLRQNNATQLSQDGNPVNTSFQNSLVQKNVGGLHKMQSELGQVKKSLKMASAGQSWNNLKEVPQFQVQRYAVDLSEQYKSINHKSRRQAEIYESLQKRAPSSDSSGFKEYHELRRKASPRASASKATPGEGQVPEQSTAVAQAVQTEDGATSPQGNPSLFGQNLKKQITNTFYKIQEYGRNLSQKASDDGGSACCGSRKPSQQPAGLGCCGARKSSNEAARVRVQRVHQISLLPDDSSCTDMSNSQNLVIEVSPSPQRHQEHSSSSDEKDTLAETNNAKMPEK